MNTFKLSPIDCGLNNGNYARIFRTDRLESELDQDVTDEPVELRIYSSIAELNAHAEQLKNEGWV